MAHHHEEPGLFQMEIGIHVDDGVVADVHPAVRILLYGVLRDSRHEVGGLVFGEPADVSSEMTFQYLGDAEI